MFCSPCLYWFQGCLFIYHPYEILLFCQSPVIVVISLLELYVFPIQLSHFFRLFHMVVHILKTIPTSLCFPLRFHMFFDAQGISFSETNTATDSFAAAM